MKKTKITKSHTTICTMTLWVRKIGLILGLAIFIISCEEPGEIGLELNPENGVFVAKYNEISLSTSIIQYEDIISDISTRIEFDRQTRRLITRGRFLVGSYSTLDFGKIQSKSFSSLYLSAARFRPNDDFVFDSLVLKINVNYLYGEKSKLTGNKRIFVHELKEEIKLDSLYLTKNSTPYNSEPLGDFNFNLSSFDSLSIVDTVFSAKLSDELGIRFLDQAKADTLTYNDNIEFRKFFNGFAFVPEEGNELITGVYAESQSTFLRLYIHDLKDTTFFDFIFDGRDNEGENITRYYNNITLDKSGTPIEGIPDFHTEFETDNGLSYSQGSTGILTKLNIGTYLDFIDTIKHLVINKAEIVMPIQKYDDFLSPSTSLDLYIADENNKFVGQVDSTDNTTIFETVGRIPFIRGASENEGKYIGDITNYIQLLTSGTLSDINLLVGQSNLWNSIITVNQTVTVKDDIQINLYYSTLQE